MPISFAQPAPAGQISRIASQGNLPAYLNAYASLAATAQNAYNQQGETNARERLGYANLFADTAMRQQALGQRREESQMEIASRHAAIQQRAQLELDQWVQQREFNARDQEELTRQQNSMSELIQKRESGEISDQEFYAQVRQSAPRVSALEAKFMATKTKQLEQEAQRGQMLNKLTQQQIADAEAFHAARANNAFGWEVDSASVGELTDAVIQKNPGLAMNPVALAQAVEEESRDRGKGHRWYQTKNGREMHPEDKARIESDMKMREQKAANEVKAREFRTKTYTDYVAHRMKPDTLGATPDFKTVSQEAEKIADAAYRASLSPDERKEYDAKQELQAKRDQEAKAQLMEFEKELKNLQDNSLLQVTPGYARDLEYLVSFYREFPAGPAYAPKEKQNEYNAAYQRALQAKRAGAGSLSDAEKAKRAIRFLGSVGRPMTVSGPEPSDSEMERLGRRRPGEY